MKTYDENACTVITTPYGGTPTVHNLITGTNTGDLIIGERGTEYIVPYGYSTTVKREDNEHAALSEYAIEQIKAKLGFYKNPLRKCNHCGQWGAVFCECMKCGAPIDPED